MKVQAGALIAELSFRQCRTYSNILADGPDCVDLR
jgi:hypothetical protein